MKYTPKTLQGQFGSVRLLNDNFDDIATELQDKILYRDNPAGEPNQMENDLDMNSNDIINAGNISSSGGTLNATSINTSSLSIAGVGVQPGDIDEIESAFQKRIDSVSGLRSGSFDGISFIWLSGYYGVGTPGGGPLYRSSDNSTADNGGTVLVDSDGVRWKRSHDKEIDATWFGVKADGSTDDRPSLTDTKDYVKSIGGGTILLPAGNILIGSQEASATGLNVDGDNIYVKGVGRFSTKLTLDDGLDAHVINFDFFDNCSISDLEVDGNRANQTLSVHCVRVTAKSNFHAYNLYLHDANGYGIGGVQSNNSVENLQLNNILIEDVGADGIDFKNPESTNIGCQMNDIIVRRFGLDSGLSSQAGIDLRGPWTVNNVTVSEYGTVAGIVGIRLRQGESAEANGAGAHKSLVNNFYVESSTKTNNTIGLECAARNCSISNGYTRNCVVGVIVQQRENNLSSITVEDCVDGFRFNTSGLTTEGERNMCHSLIARDIDDDCFIVDTSENYFSGCIARNGAQLLTFTSNAGNNIFSGGQLVLPGVSTVGDSGTNNSIFNTFGWKTRNNFLTAALAVDSTGNFTFTQPHGLDVTPELQDIQITIIEDTNIGDYEIRALRVGGLDSTDISVEGDVTVASSSPGATVKFAVALDTTY